MHVPSSCLHLAPNLPYHPSYIGGAMAEPCKAATKYRVDVPSDGGRRSCILSPERSVDQQVDHRERAR
jgi:hypothetical protein